MTRTVAEIAGGLTAAQRRVLANGLQGRDTIVTLLALRARGLMVDYAARPVNGGWQITPLGLLVRNHLIEAAGDE